MRVLHVRLQHRQGQLATAEGVVISRPSVSVVHLQLQHLCTGKGRKTKRQSTVYSAMLMSYTVRYIRSPLRHCRQCRRCRHRKSSRSDRSDRSDRSSTVDPNLPLQRAVQDLYSTDRSNLGSMSCIMQVIRVPPGNTSWIIHIGNTAYLPCPAHLYYINSPHHTLGIDYPSHVWKRLKNHSTLTSNSWSRKASMIKGALTSINRTI